MKTKKKTVAGNIWIDPTLCSCEKGNENAVDGDRTWSKAGFLLLPETGLEICLRNNF